ncbi:MAG: hypothetical protein IPK08_17925 [Bacteroidetes bacterium]|nr:hypothetical protein [Bacteroidota bacterium]
MGFLLMNTWISDKSGYNDKSIIDGLISAMISQWNAIKQALLLMDSEATG